VIQHPIVPRSVRRSAPASTAVAVLVAVLLMLAAPALALAAPAPAPGVAPGAPSGWVRLGHLSPKTPPVDIYLSPFGQPQRVAFRQAAYGAVTPYTTLAPGTYTVSMRPANAPASSPPALSANVDVKADTANTMLVFENGPNGTIRGQMLTDDLSAPAAGAGKVRVVQGAPDPDAIEVNAVGGPALASGLKYGDAGQYVTVPQGHWNVALRSGETVTPAAIDVRSASVCTVVVVHKPSGLTLTELPDAAGTASAPAGGAETGGGGTAPGSFPLVPVLIVGLAVGALTVSALRAGSSRRTRRELGA
jgi:Domain of unknown function (DUF4397)